MKFKCGQKNLSSAISTIQRAISSRITLPILEGFLIEAKENMLRLVGTDLDLITIQTYIPAEIIEEGSAVALRVLAILCSSRYYLRASGKVPN